MNRSSIEGPALPVAAYLERSGARYSDAIQRSLASYYPLNRTSDLDEVSRLLASCRCGVVVLGRDAESLGASVEISAGPPVVVVGLPRVAYEPIAELVYAVVPASLVDVTLLRIVSAAVVDDVIRRLHDVVMRRDDLLSVPHLRRGLAHVLVMDAVVPSVQAMAKMATCGTRKLERDWSAVTPHGGGRSLKQVLVRLTLLKAIGHRCREPHRPWLQIATALGVTPATLRAYAQQFLQKPLVAVTPRGAASGVVLLERWLSETLGG